MNLNDLLVSYKQVIPDEPEEIQEKLPMDRYQRMLQYIDNKQVKEEKEDVSETPQIVSSGDDYGFGGWFLSESSTQIPQTTQNNTPFTSKSDWANKLSESYRKLGLSDNAIRNLIAKNALESSWGKSAQGKYNYGNITTGKYWKGDYVDGKDHDSKGNTIHQRFRSYKSLDDFAKDEVDFLTQLYEFNPDDDFETFAQKLQGNNKDKRRYAADLQYIDKIRNVYNKLS